MISNAKEEEKRERKRKKRKKKRSKPETEQQYHRASMSKNFRVSADWVSHLASISAFVLDDPGKSWIIREKAPPVKSSRQHCWLSFRMQLITTLRAAEKRGEQPLVGLAFQHSSWVKPWSSEEKWEWGDPPQEEGTPAYLWEHWYVSQKLDSKYPLETSWPELTLPGLGPWNIQ